MSDLEAHGTVVHTVQKYKSHSKSVLEPPLAAPALWNAEI